MCKTLDRSTTTLYGQIANIWRERIISGQYEPGDILPSEREMAAELQVSRIPVREAMKSLEYLGVVKQIRGKGVMVQSADLSNILRVAGPLMNKITPEILQNLFDFRVLIEPYAAQQAALLATESDLEGLKEVIEVHRKAIERGELAEEMSFEFHLRIMQASHNEVISIVSEFLGELQRHSRHLTLWNNSRRENAFEGHLAIYKAIVERDADRAYDAMYKHLTEAKAVLTVEPTQKK